MKEKNTKSKKSDNLSKIILVFLSGLFLAFFILISFAPLVWVILSSFKSNKEILQSAFTLPTRFGFEGYAAALEVSPIFKYYFNSIVISSLSTIANVILVSMAAYVFVRVTFKGKTLLLALLSSSLLIPTSAIFMPIYMIFTKTGLYDTKLGLIIVYAALGLPVSLFIMRGYILGVPKEIEEAAHVDGSGFFRTFFTIVMPMCKPGLATVATLQFLLSWNEFMFALILTKSQSVRTLPLALNYFKSQFTFNYTAMFAALAMVVIPSIVIYFILQEQVNESIVAGAVKG